MTTLPAYPITPAVVARFVGELASAEQHLALLRSRPGAAQNVQVAALESTITAKRLRLALCRSALPRQRGRRVPTERTNECSNRSDHPAAASAGVAAATTGIRAPAGARGPHRATPFALFVWSASSASQRCLSRRSAHTCSTSGANGNRSPRAPPGRKGISDDG